MNQLKILNKKEKVEIENKLKAQFGIKNVNGIFVKRGAERIFLFQGSYSKEQIKHLEKLTQIERVGVYFAKEMNDKIRLSVDGVHILKDQITKNIYEIDEEQAKQWMMGQELNITTGKKDFVIIRYKDYFLGCGKASAEKITNFIPKNRRLKK